MSKLVFLDFDGVLTTHATKYHHGDSTCVARLNRITDATGAQIVVSSSWRNDTEGMAALLAAWGVTGKVIGVTPRLERVRESGILVTPERGHEIDRWLAKNKFAGAFVILDDDADMAHLIDRLVRTDTRLGLQDADVERAIKLLGG